MSGLDVSENVMERVRFGADGLIPAIVQDATSGQVLTLAWMNRESLERTLAEGRTWFWSRSRSDLWNKGAPSGHTQTVRSIAMDCAQDALVVLVDQTGVACHPCAHTFFPPPVAGPPL